MDRQALTRWLLDRLTNDRARDEWRRLVEASWAHLESEPLGKILPAAEVEAFARHYLTVERVTDVVRPIVRGAVFPVIREARADHAKVGRWVPEDARRAILAIAERKKLVHPAWIESVFREEAAEAIFADTLFKALRDFSQLIPRLIQDLSPLGKIAKLGGFGGDKSGLGSRVVEELGKRLEPEIRRFLEAGTRKALDGAARFAVDHLDDPLSVKFRKNMVGFVLDQTGAFHTHAMSDEVLAEIDQIADRIARHVAGTDEAKQRLADAVARIAAAHGQRPIKDVLAELGVTQPAPHDEWAALTWPVVQGILRTPAVEAWLGDLAVELVDAAKGG
ncbi:hypothetical protein L6R52_16295 [Myxococcota bacterium]|nr:hypothetical protein [Myxococcota bacterium]